MPSQVPSAEACGSLPTLKAYAGHEYRKHHTAFSRTQGKRACGIMGVPRVSGHLKRVGERIPCYVRPFEMGLHIAEVIVFDMGRPRFKS